MTTSLKDVDSAQMVNFLASVGGVDEQYNAYGYAFYQNGKANYLVGDDYHQILQQHRESIWDKQLATPIEKIVLVDSLLSGTKDDSLFKLKLTLAKQLYNRYPLSYFKEQQLLLSGKETNDGWAILKQWQQEIDGYFEAEHLLLFEEVVRMAYENNTLDQAHCGELRSWIKRVKLQMDDNVVVKDQYCRTFWGFLRLQNEQNKLICNSIHYQRRCCISNVQN